MKPSLHQLKKGKILLSDGAWGTMLMEKGLIPGECPERWNASHRDNVLDVAKQYIDAGADIIETNSFGGSLLRLEHFGMAAETEKLNMDAAKISREAAGTDKLVFGSVGPCGKILMMEEVTEDQVYNSFAVQVKALAKGGVDAILIETMTALDEATLAVKAAKENTDLPVACTFTFEKTANGDYRTMMGVSPKEMLDTLLAAGADIIGTNCGNGFDKMIEIAREFRKQNSNIPLMIQANAGIPEIVEGKNIYPEKPDEMASKIPQLIELGVNIIGGCCGTSPAHIAKFREIINSYNIA